MPKDRHALQGTLLPVLIWAQNQARKERPRHDLLFSILVQLGDFLHAQIHIIELHDDTMRRLPLRINGIRVATFRPHEPTNVPERTIHQPSLWPLVVRVQHARPLAQVQHMRPSTEFVGVHFLGLHVPLCALVTMIRPQGSDGHLALQRQLLELPQIDLQRTIDTRISLLSTVHQ